MSGFSLLLEVEQAASRSLYKGVTASDVLAASFCGVPSSLTNRSVLVSILVLGGDESSDGDRNGPFLFAAYGAFYPVWKAFVNSWESIVRRPPDLWPYHSYDWRSAEWRESRSVTRSHVSGREEELRSLIHDTAFLFHITSMVSCE